MHIGSLQSFPSVRPAHPRGMRSGLSDTAPTRAGRRPFHTDTT